MIFGKLFGRKKQAQPEPQPAPVAKDWNDPRKGGQRDDGEKDGEPVIVEFSKLGTRCEVPAGSTLLDAVLKAEIEIEHYCGGMASCGSCRIIVVSGDVSPMDDMEQVTLEMVIEDDRERLACQCFVRGPVVLQVVEAD